MTEGTRFSVTHCPSWPLTEPDLVDCSGCPGDQRWPCGTLPAHGTGAEDLTVILVETRSLPASLLPARHQDTAGQRHLTEGPHEGQTAEWRWKGPEATVPAPDCLILGAKSPGAEAAPNSFLLRASPGPRPATGNAGAQVLWTGLPPTWSRQRPGWPLVQDRETDTCRQRQGRLSAHKP